VQLQSNCSSITRKWNYSLTYNGNLSINVTNSHPSTQIQVGVVGVSTLQWQYSCCEILAGGTSSGILFNNGAAASSTLAAGRTIALGAGGIVSGELYHLLRFTQVSATPQTLSTSNW
jgi:hypothetical protein